MAILRRLWSLLTGSGSRLDQPLDNWFAVKCGEEVIRIDASPPGGESWHQELRWVDIERVCFKAEGLDVSDGLYIFTKIRPESYVIPLDAKGGDRLWAELIDKELFDADLAIEAASATEGIFCWPPMDEPEES